MAWYLQAASYYLNQCFWWHVASLGHNELINSASTSISNPLYIIIQELCERFALCCGVLWFDTDWYFSEFLPWQQANVDQILWRHMASLDNNESINNQRCCETQCTLYFNKYARALSCFVVVEITSLAPCIYNYIHYDMRGETTYPFPNFNGCTVEVWKLISSFTPHF